MAELRPDAWRMEELLYSADRSTLCPGSVKNIAKKRPVTDILTWIECFSVMSAIIAAKFPERASHLFAYQRTIVRASQLFEGPAWVNYDAQFRRKASMTKSWEWGSSDTALYNECFTGRAKAKTYCRFCYSDTHADRYCPLTTPAHYSPVGIHSQWGNEQHFYNNRRPITAQPNLRPGADTGDNAKKVVELCGRFNKSSGNECTFLDCRYAHICSRCTQGPHPASRCPGPRPQGPRQRRFPLLPQPST